MAVETLLDELLSIACGSIDAHELESRFHQLAKSHQADRENLATEVLRSVELLRIEAKGMESLALRQSSQRELEQMNLNVNDTRDRADGLRREADELERVAVAAGVIEPRERPESLFGIWKGMEITEEEIQSAKRSLFRSAYDESI